MSQTTQKKTVKPTATPVAVPAVAVVAAPVAVSTVAPAKAKATKAKVDVVPVVATAVVATAPKAVAPPKATASATASATDATSSVAGTATETAATTTEVASVASHEELESLANDMIKMAKRVLEVSRLARKDFAKQVKKAEQGGKKRRAKNADGSSTHSNSVFLQPSKISPALAKFCGVTDETMISRTDATRKIAAYIKEHNLQNPENRREILSDATLISLFALTSEDKLNYFNLQRYIKPHFIKEIKVVA
jgi:upstream activation factor subunit UAF30